MLTTVYLTTKEGHAGKSDVVRGVGAPSRLPTCWGQPGSAGCFIGFHIVSALPTGSRRVRTDLGTQTVLLGFILCRLSIEAANVNTNKRRHPNSHALFGDVLGAPVK
jgi:hypothetical protein